MDEEKSRAVEEAVSKTRKEWSSESSQSDIADQIAAAKREWIKNHNDELERRLSNAIEEVRRIWDEEQKLKTKEVIWWVLHMPQNFSRRFRGKEASFSLLTPVEVVYSILVLWFVIFCDTAISRNVVGEKHKTAQANP